MSQELDSLKSQITKFCRQSRVKEIEPILKLLPKISTTRLTISLPGPCSASYWRSLMTT